MPDSTAAFRVETTAGKPGGEASAIVMRVAGNLDVANVQDLESELVRAVDGKPQLIVVDLAGVDMLSSVAMGALLRAHHGLKRNGGKLLLASVTPGVLSAIRRARIDLVVGVRASVEAALASAGA